MKLQHVRSNLEHFGVYGTLHDLTHRAVNRIIVWRVLKGVKTEVVNSEYLHLPPRYRAAFLSEENLQQIAADPAYEMSPAFLTEALAKGDQCFGILDNNTLAAYGWYATTPTRIDLPGLVLKFDPEYVYMYKGLVHPNYRGQRLHAFGMTMALRAYLGGNKHGFVSYVESSNHASLKSVYRMGYQDFGRISVARIRNRYFIHCDCGCKALNFSLERFEAGPGDSSEKEPTGAHDALIQTPKLGN